MSVVLRTPLPSNANNERNVNTSGALNNNNANNNNGAAADYKKYMNYHSSMVEHGQNE